MSDKTGIEWTDATWNPVRGCSRVSEGCRHCYAEAVAARFSGPGLPYEGLAKDGKWTGKVKLIEKHLADPLRWTKPRRIFVNSMSDLFHEGLRDEDIDKVFAVMALAPQHTYQVLTKRATRMKAYLADEATPARIARAIDAFEVDQEISRTPYEIRKAPGFEGYFVDNTGQVFTIHGSGHCVWCRAVFESGQQDSLYCGQKCRSASHYAKSQGRNPEPAGRIMRKVGLDVGEDGHSRVRFLGGERELVHRLVLRTFGAVAPDGAQACHRDGNPRRNHICNLRWGSQSENWKDRVRHGNGRSYAKLDSEQVERIRHRLASGHPAERIARDFGISSTQVRNIGRGDQWASSGALAWPLPGVWCGVSVEDQKTADERIPLLLQAPAALRFISYEPALGPVNLLGHLMQGPDPGQCLNCKEGHGFCRCPNYGGVQAVRKTIRGSVLCNDFRRDVGCGLGWVIVGGESGPNARPFDVAWALHVVKECKAAGVACFVKQLGANVVGRDCEHGREGKACRFLDRKGGDMAEWPQDLRVRQFPEVR